MSDSRPDGKLPGNAEFVMSLIGGSVFFFALIESTRSYDMTLERVLSTLYQTRRDDGVIRKISVDARRASGHISNTVTCSF